MPTLRLTARTIDALKADSTQQIDYFDESLPGFAVRVSKHGKKSWCVVYRHANKVRRLTLGSYPPISLADARDMARDALRDAQTGADPGAQKRANRQAETFKELADDFMERYSKKRKKSWAEDQRIIDSYLKPRFRHSFAKEVTRAQVRQMLEEIAERAPVQANRVLAVIRKIYRWALEQDLVETTPCLGISAPGEEHQRDRVLNDEELKRVWNAFDGEDLLIASMFKLRLLTAQRGGEVAAMEWSEIDFDNAWWTIPAEKSKKGLTHRVPLSQATIRILKAVQARKAKTKRIARSPWVFPSPRGNDHIREMQKATQRIRKTAEVNFRAHDLRRTAASVMASMGVARLTISKILNHVETGVTAVYETHSYDQEKREALEAWSRKLIGIISNLELRERFVERQISDKVGSSARPRTKLVGSSAR